MNRSINQRTIQAVAALFAVVALVPSFSHASKKNCRSLFEQLPYEKTIPRNRPTETVRIEYALFRTVDLPGIVSDRELDIIYSGVQTGRKAGAAALAYMRNLPPALSSDTKAKVWMDLANGIVRRKRLMFISDFYKTRDGRFLFRGGEGETLFIDKDGTVYLLRTPALRDGQIWFVDYSEMTPL